MPFVFPSGHPFNPLVYLRLAIAAGYEKEAIGRIFDALWTTGADPADPALIARLAASLGVEQLALTAPDVKQALRDETHAAATLGVFGVPTLVVDHELFWGADAMAFAAAFIADRSILASEAMRRVDALPVGATRR